MGSSWQFMVSFLVFLIALNGGYTEFIKDMVTLTIDQGTLSGQQSFNYWNETFFSFIGIPFAKPPIGPLRFKAPEPAEPWTGTYDATKVRPMCPQRVNPLMYTKGLEISEDCLFLSVFSKMSTELKPVMVWFHGGGYRYGSIFEPNYGPELLMTKDIVLVKVAYRVNVFGFLRIDDPKYGIHGNAGLKDLIMGLKWVQKNIKKFGGDPKKVTIFGNSSGGSAVNLLHLSPMGKGLFHRAIVQSGSAGFNWLRTDTKYAQLAKVLNCSIEDLEICVSCINAASTDSIVKILEKIEDSFNIISIEDEKSPESLLPISSEELAQSGNFSKAPIIFGFNTHEGELLVDVNPVSPNLTDYRGLIPPDIRIDRTSEEATKLGNRIKQFYYGNQTPSFDLLDPYIDYSTDAYFLYQIYYFSKEMAAATKDTPVYLYEFNYFTKLNPQRNRTKNYVSHVDELPYMFYHEGRTPKNLEPNSEEFIAIHRMLNMWVEFAETGNPNPKNDPLLNVTWLPLESNKFNYLKIGQNMELKQNVAAERMKFWDKVYEDYSKTY